MKSKARSIIGLGLLAAAAHGASFPMVEPGGHALIVGQSLFLNSAIERCTGAALPAVPESQYAPKPGDRPIYVGDTRKAREVLAGSIAMLDAEGYIFFVTNDFAVIYAGRPATPTGTPQVWAEADFARRFMGVDHFFLGELGQVYPKLETVTVPCGLYVENPAFRHRHWSGYAGAAGPGWRVRASGGGYRFAFHHNLFNIVSPEAFRDHPDYFPEIDGRRTIPTSPAGWQPCTSHPAVRRLTIDYVLNHFAQNPASASCSLGLNDSGGYCLCPACLANTPAGLDPKSREAIAYRFFAYYNAVAEEVAKTHLDVRLGFLAYGALNPAERAPRKLHPLLMPYITQNQADAFDPAYRKRLDDQFAGWSQIAAHFGLYEYLHGDGFIIPRLYPHELAKGLKQAHALGADGFYAEAYPNWGLDGPKLWVTEKLLWDPAQDVDALLDTWHRALFGEAAREMRAYFDRLERAWMEQQPSSPARGGYRLLNDKKAQLSEVFPPPVCDEAWALLEAAEQAARQAIVRRRIAYFKNSFGATRLASRRFAEAEKLQTLLADNAHRSSYDWLTALNELAGMPTLDAYVRGIADSAPYAFQAFCAAAAEKKAIPSFAAWDRDTPVILRAAEALLQEAMRREGTPPASQAELQRVIGSILETHAARARAEGSRCDASIARLRPVLAQYGLDARRLPAAPVLDGRIEETWGEPAFDGRFFAYGGDRACDWAGPRTRLWIGISSNRLYVAFHCLQDTNTILPGITTRDAVTLNDRKRIQLPASGFPYYAGDAVGLLLPACPDYPLAVVTAGGGIFDGLNSAYGYTVDWNGAEAQTAVTDDGWSAEIGINLGRDSDQNKESVPFRVKPPQGGAVGFNFIRITGKGERSTWTPAPPSRWSVSPGSSGVVFFP